MRQNDTQNSQEEKEADMFEHPGIRAYRYASSVNVSISSNTFLT
jgi:hypothetical protein